MALGTSLPARLPASSGASIFVATTGNDATGTGLIGAPYRTLAKALSVAVSGSVIELRGGTYSENVFLTGAKFSPADPVTIRNYTGEKVIWQPTTADTVGIAIYDSSGIIFRAQGDAEKTAAGFQLSCHGARSNMLKFSSSAHCEVDGLYCYDNYGQAILVGGSYQDSRTAGQPGYSIDIQLWNCTFTHNSVDPNQSLTGSEVNRTQAALNIAQRHGHSIYYGNNADSTNGEQGSLDGVVANCVFHDQSEGFSMRIGDCARGLIITNNTVDTSTSPASTVSDELVAHGFPPADGHFWGIAISLSNGTNIGTYSTRDVKVYNNLTSNCMSDGVYGSEGGNPAVMASNTVDYNYWFNNGQSDDALGGIWSDTYGGRQIYTVGANNTPAQGTAAPYNPPDHDPLYVDAAGFDFSLDAGSPCLGIANSAYCPPLDKNGNARPEPAAVGAFEASTTSVTGAAALTGTGTLAASGVRKRLGIAALSGTGTLSANGVVGPEGGAGRGASSSPRSIVSETLSLLDNRSTGPPRRLHAERARLPRGPGRKRRPGDQHPLADRDLARLPRPEHAPDLRLPARAGREPALGLPLRRDRDVVEDEGADVPTTRYTAYDPWQLLMARPIRDDGTPFALPGVDGLTFPAGSRASDIAACCSLRPS
jgi:hypothetical protein